MYFFQLENNKINLRDQEQEAHFWIDLNAEKATASYDAFKPINEVMVLHYYFEFFGEKNGKFKINEVVKKETHQGQGEPVTMEIYKPLAEIDKEDDYFVLFFCNPFDGTPIFESYLKAERIEDGPNKGQYFWTWAVWSPEEKGANFPALFYGNPIEE